MQDYLAEIKGTMARTSQKRNAMLNKHLRKKASAESELPPRPVNPADCKDAKLAEKYVHQIQREFSHQLSQLLAMTDEPESDIRKANTTINAKLRERAKWANRVAALTGKPLPDAKAHKTKFFGPAMNLPEALKEAAPRASKKRRTEQEDETMEEEEEDDMEEDAEYDDSDDDDDGYFDDTFAGDGGANSGSNKELSKALRLHGFAVNPSTEYIMWSKDSNTTSTSSLNPTVTIGDLQLGGTTTAATVPLVVPSAVMAQANEQLLNHNEQQYRAAQHSGSGDRTWKKEEEEATTNALQYDDIHVPTMDEAKEAMLQKRRDEIRKKFNRS